MKQSHVGAGLVILVIVAGNLLYARHQHNERMLHEMMQGGGTACGPLISRTADEQRKTEDFERLWFRHGQRAIAAELLPYLEGRDRELREKAIVALGRLESPLAEAPLAEFLKKLEQEELEDQRELHNAQNHVATNYVVDFSKRIGVKPLKLRLALGRIRARDLKGQAKVEAVAQSVGVSWDDVLVLSKRLNPTHPSIRGSMIGTRGDQIMEEIVDTLYKMGKEGEDIQPLSGRLTLNPSQQLKLRGAAVSLDQEVHLILDYLVTLPAATGDAYTLTDYLVGLGPRATELVLQRLQDMKRQPEKYFKNRSGYIIVFLAAGQMDDARALPLLKYFSARSPHWDYWVQSNAGAWKELEWRLKRAKTQPTAITDK